MLSAKKIFLIFTSLFLADTISQARIQKPYGFYSKKTFFKIEPLPGYIAVRKISNSKSDVTFSTKFPYEDAQLSKLGLVIINAAARKNIHEYNIVGIPIWFNRMHHAIGILSNELIIRTKSTKILLNIKKIPNAISSKKSKFDENVHLIKATTPEVVISLANKLSLDKNIIYAHPNFWIPLEMRQSSPTLEPYFTLQWHLENTGEQHGNAGADIDARKAWDVTAGASDSIIAIIDGGFESSHVDLEKAWFKNRSEIPNNNIDDDMNGFIDDVSGWNFATNTAEHSNSSHGTAVAGLAGARVNDHGVTGVCPKCKILPITMGRSLFDTAEAFRYAKSFSVQVISNSWGYPLGVPGMDAIIDAIDDTANNGRNGLGTSIVFSMTNSDRNNCATDDLDISSLPSVIAVSASNAQDKKVQESGWGPCMEILAPTKDKENLLPGLATTDVTGTEGYNPREGETDVSDDAFTSSFGGTSGAAPIIAGVLGLMFSLEPNMNAKQAKEILLRTASRISPELAHYDRSGFSLTYGYGRVNAGTALEEMQQSIKAKKR
ncbi:MAG: S8 family serine peptidase [Bdellovibrionota bacterium]